MKKWSYILGNYNVQYYIEGNFAQDEFVNDFDTEGDERGWHIPITADKKSKSEKFDRIESMAGHFERKSIYFNFYTGCLSKINI